MKDLNTKQKILLISHKLFAEKGFNGVSVREIAKECDVNISAVNYHFTNKESLYIETIRLSMHETEKSISELYDGLEEKSIENLASAVYEFFKDNSEDLKTGFKLVISSDKYHKALGEDETLFKGPPGGDFFFQSLKKEFPKAQDPDLLWAVRTIFTQVIHKAIMSCNHKLCADLQKLSTDGGDILLEDILRLVRVVKKDL